MTKKRKATIGAGCAIVLVLIFLGFWPIRSSPPNVKVYQCPPHQSFWAFFKRSTPIASDDSVELERGPCFGTCPAYTVTLRGDGTITWRGDSYVKVAGMRTSRIPSSEAKALINSFRTHNFFALCGNYQRGVTDFPTVITKVSIAGRSKTVINYAFAAPGWLPKLNQEVDRVADTARWRGDDGVKGNTGVLAFTARPPE